MTRTDWKQEVEKLKFENKLSWTEITNIIKRKYFPTDEWQKVRDRTRDYIRKLPRYIEQHYPKEIKNYTEIITERPTGVFGDPHIPFDHPGYLPFLIETFKQFNVDKKVCVGDLADFHSLSRFIKETGAMSSKTELKSTIERIKPYTRAFPECKMIPGNHTERPYRRAAENGIDPDFMKPLKELLELPNGWEVAEEFIIDNVLYKHGENCTGKNGALNTAIEERMSTVIGHSHAFGGCEYTANKRSIIFGMNVGSGVDVSSYAFTYGKHSKFRPTLGCGIVFSDSYAIFVPMPAKFFRSA